MPPPQSRFGRRPFLAIAYLGALMVAIGWFDDLSPLLHSTVPLRAGALAAVGGAVQVGMVSQKRGERLLFWVALGLVVTRLLFDGDASVERTAMTVIASGSLLLPLALLVAPRRRRVPWAGATLALCLAAGGMSIIPERPSGFLVLTAYMGALWAMLMVFERHAQTADEMWGMAHIDELTGLANRRAIQQELDHTLTGFRAAMATGDRLPASLLMIDLDRFKELNDAAGHAAGDQALRLVAAVLHSMVGPPSIVGRWGGEEFLILLRGPDCEQAMTVAEDIRAAIARTTAVTASVGVADLSCDDDAFSWMHRADTALYEAKSAGRDTVVIRSSTQDPLVTNRPA